MVSRFSVIGVSGDNFVCVSCCVVRRGTSGPALFQVEATADLIHEFRWVTGLKDEKTTTVRLRVAQCAELRVLPYLLSPTQIAKNFELYCVIQSLHGLLQEAPT